MVQLTEQVAGREALDPPFRRSLAELFTLLGDLLAPVLAPACPVAAAGVSSPVTYSITHHWNPSGIRPDTREVQRVPDFGFPSLDNLGEG